MSPRMNVWLRQLVDHYAKRAAALQTRNMKLYQSLSAIIIPTSRRRAKEASHLALDNSTKDEVESFMSLHEAFKNVKMLIHFNPERKLYITLDSSGMGTEAIIYNSERNSPAQNSVLPIIFLLKPPEPTEARCWPTGLEIAELC